MNPLDLDIGLELSDMSASDAKDVVVCRILMPLPSNYSSYHARLMANHPDYEFMILGRMEIGEGSLLEDISVKGPGIPEVLTEELKRGKGVKSVEFLGRSPDNQVHNYRLTIEMAPLARILKELQVLVRYPIPFQEPVAKILVVASKPRVRELLRRMKEIAPDTSIQAINTHRLEGSRGSLSARQLEVFRVAISAGYWEVPRRTSLTELAKRLGIAKSTLSGMLATIENKLMLEAKDLYLTHQVEGWGLGFYNGVLVLTDST